MRVLSNQEDSVRFFQELASAKQRILVVDYDKVIAPLRAARNAGVPVPTVAELLDCIMTTSRTRVVLITSRRAEELKPSVAGPAADVWGTEEMESLLNCASKGRDTASGIPSTAMELMITSMLTKIGDDAALAYFGDRNMFAAVSAEENAGNGGGEAFVQFLVDWLRVCGGEIC